MSKRSPYRPITEYESLAEGTLVWHPMRGEGKVTAKTSSYLFVFFTSSRHIGRVGRAEVLSIMGAR